MVVFLLNTLMLNRRKHWYKIIKEDFLFSAGEGFNMSYKFSHGEIIQPLVGTGFWF